MSADIGPISTPYGFSEDPRTRALLRSRPPQTALIWATHQVAAATITRVQPLRGGLSSAVHLLTARMPDGGSRQLVLRRYVRADLNAEEPDIAQREAAALCFAEPLDLPTPILLASDPPGEQAGVPSLLMSRLPGRVEWSPNDMDRWLDRLVDLLPRIHGASLPPPGTIRPYSAYQQRRYDPPGWACRPAIWKRAVDIFHGPALDRSPNVFIHRDFHPGNVLWRRGRVSGLVDWQSASVGPACVDVGHCRANLLRYGLDVAGRFTRRWEQNTGHTYHPWADIVTLIGCLDDIRDPAPRNHGAIDDVISRAVAELRPGSP